jgi:TonB family protein
MTESWKQWEGQVVDGKFHLRQYLGGSDHSAVFLTEFAELEPRRAAIKLIAADPDNAEIQLSRWALAAKLSHPNLIRLFQIGRCRLANVELLYAVMEYAGEDLSQILPQRPLTPAESQDMVLPVLDVLSYLHRNGLVHGHLKPSNIMAVDDQLRISSDGLCRAGESIGGLPSVYDPPETASRGISPAADVWSLGMTLVEALTQRLPVWERTKQEEPVVPKTLPEPFLDIARQCLRGDPHLRWTVGDIKARLLAPTSSVLREQTMVRPKPFRRPLYIIPTVVVLALLAILAGSRRSRRPPLPPPVPSAASVTPAPSPALEHPEVKTASGGVVQGAVENQVLPEVPQRARDTIRGTVRVTVRVTVDPSGSVTRATLDSAGPSKYFADLALQAARRWKFRPRTLDGRKVPSEWILRFQFEKTATKVLPVEVAPYGFKAPVAPQLP